MATLHDARDTCAIGGVGVVTAALLATEGRDSVSIAGHGITMASLAATEGRDTASILGTVAFLTTANLPIVEAADGGATVGALPILTVERDALADPYSKDMSWYSMHKMNDGRLLIAGGGYHSAGVRVNSVRAYNPQSRLWQELQPNDFGATRWDSTDNKFQWFVSSLGAQGQLVYGTNGVYDVATNAWIASTVSPNPPVSSYIDLLTVDPGYLNLGFNAATAWFSIASPHGDQLDAGIGTQAAEGGNSPGPNNYWSWLDRNPNYPATSAKPLRLRNFAPPSIFADANFYPDGQGNGGWLGCRNYCVAVGEFFYVGGGFVWNFAQTNRDRLNTRFFKIHIPTLYAAANPTAGNAAVTELAPGPVATYPQLTYDSSRQCLLLINSNKINCYDIATDSWSDITPTDPDWKQYNISGWMGAYDATTDAHYIREGQDGDPTDPLYNQYNNTEYTQAGRMRKIQFSTASVDPGSGRWSTMSMGTWSPYTNYGMKHVTLLYDNTNDELIQCGGDFYSGGMTQPDGSPFVLGSTKRDMWMAKPATGTLNWTQVQPEFMPSPQFQGAGGPDQIWWQYRTAVSPAEYWLLPGAYRATQYERDPSLSPYPMKPAYWGDLYAAMRWTRPGWVPAANKHKVAPSAYTGAPDQIRRLTEEPDKFAAYDPSTDASYCINDDFEIVKFGYVAKDWTITVIGRPAADDNGFVLTGSIPLSSGGSLMARIDRRIYGLCAWAASNGGQTKTYLAWYDIDAGTRGLILCPFDIDPLFYVAGAPNFGQRNPEESGGLVALNRGLVVMRTYDAVAAGGLCVWHYNVDTAAWTVGQAAPFTLWGRAWCALPSLGSVIFFGTTDEPYDTDLRAFLYRITP